VRSAKSCDDGRSIELLNINVLQDNRDFERTVALVRKTDADVVLFLETDQGWADALMPLHELYPHRSSAPMGNTYGMILMSRWPMEAEVRYRVKDDIPSIDATVTMPSGEQIALFALHPEPPRPGDDTGPRDVELVFAGREVREDGRAALVLGDLNDVAWSATSKLFRKVSGTLDPRVGRGLYPTFNAKYPIFQWPLDHMFVTPHWRIEAIDRLGNVGSDHYPIVYRACLTKPAGQRRTSSTPSPDAQAEAQEEVREGLKNGDGR
jgi:endonuclease/exonuclease/phosphatase (EEP) superfamily protein YafD